MHLMSGVCALVTKAEFEYWGIDELLLEPCCALKYYPEIELCHKEVEGEETSKKKLEERRIMEDFGSTKWGKIRKYLWNLTEYPETSKAAQATAFLSLGVVVISTVCFILSTFPELQDDYESVDYDDTSATAQTAEFVILVTDNATEDSGDTFHGLDLENLFEWPEVNYSEIKRILNIIDWVTVGYFCLEYILRFSCAPRKVKFFVKPMNLVDFLAILPYFISAVIDSLQDLHILSKAGKIMRLVRVMRILRIFKLVRHFAGLQSLLYTLKQRY